MRDDALRFLYKHVKKGVVVEGKSMVTGILDKQTIRRFIEELEQADQMLKAGRVGV